MKFNAIAWNALQRRWVFENAFGRTRAFVEISIRHNGFHVGSFRFASSRYIRFAFLKNRLTGSNPTRGTDIPLLPLPLCPSPPPLPSSSPRATLFAPILAWPARASKPTRESEILRGASDEESRCTPFSRCDLDRARTRVRALDVPRSGKSSSRLDSFATHRFPILAIKFYGIPLVFIYTFQERTNKNTATISILRFGCLHLSIHFEHYTRD